MAAPKLPFRPLERLRTDEMTDVDFAAHLGVERTTIRKWRQGGISLYTADSLVCRLGFHPTYFWGDAYFECDDINEEVDCVA